MRTFSQVPIRIWRDKAFRALSDDGKLALLSLWCGPHSTSAGVLNCEDGFGALVLDWPIERWQAARAEIEARGLAQWSKETDEVWLPDFFTTNKPANAAARAAVTRQIAAIESRALREAAAKAFQAVNPATEGNGTPSRLQTPYLNGQRR